MRILAIVFFLLLAVVVGTVELLAILDSVGSKMADDNDPFGNSYILWYQHALYIFVTVVCLMMTVVLQKKMKK